MNGEEVIEEPKVGMVFNSKEETFICYLNYAKQKGFGLIWRSSKRGDYGNSKYFALACSKTRKIHLVGKDLFKPKFLTKMGCKAIMIFKVCVDGKFEVTTVQLDHNHLLIPGKARHFRCNIMLDEHVKMRLELNDQVRISATKNYQYLMVEVFGYEKVTLNQKDCCNSIEKVRQTRLDMGDVEAVCKYFTNMHDNDPNFFYAMDIDEDCRIRNLFRADGKSKTIYEAFGDVITFDTTYLTNKYSMTFASFVEVNHHG
ncbi:hypothetical protein REPUB_Repub03eG0124000 [Reevesia pubescens]